MLLLGILPRGQDPQDRLRKVNDATNGMMAKLADGESIHYLNLDRHFLQPDGTISREMMPDFLHLRKRGYEILADAIEPTVARTVARRLDWRQFESQETVRWPSKAVDCATLRLSTALEGHRTRA